MSSLRAPSPASSAQPRRSAGSRKKTRRPHGAGVGGRLLVWLQKRLGRSIRVQGQGMQMRLVVEKMPVVPAAPEFPGMVKLKTLSAEKQETMRKDLRRLLRQHPQTKNLLRHLAYVEHTLRHDGVQAMDDLPLEVLSKALEQLETLVVNWSASGLGEARSRLSVLVKNKQIVAQHLGRDAPMTEMDPSQRADVCEVSHSVFEEMDRSWRGQVPPTLTAALSSPGAAASR